MTERSLQIAIRRSTDLTLPAELRSRWFKIVRKLHAQRTAEQVKEMEIVRGLAS